MTDHATHTEADTAAAAVAYAERVAAKPYTVTGPAAHTVFLYDGAYDIHAAQITDADGQRYYVADISGNVSPNEMANHRPDPENPGMWTWDAVHYPAGTFKVYTTHECLAHIDRNGQVVG